MENLSNILWYILSPLGFLGVVLLYVLLCPNQAKTIWGWFVSLFGKISFWARKNSVKNTLEGACELALTDLRKAVPDMSIPKLLVEWVENDNVLSQVRNGEVIVPLSFSRDNTTNIVKATTAYVRDSFLPHAKPFLSYSFRNSIDLSVIKLILLQIPHNNKLAFSRFIEENRANLSAHQAVMNKIAQIDDAGLFTRMMVRELDSFGNHLLGRIPNEEFEKEGDDFLEFLYQIASREPEEFTRLSFNKPDIKVGVLLVAKKETYYNAGLKPYFKRIQQGFALGVETFYLLAREDKIEILDKVVNGLLETGNFEVVNRPLPYDDRKQREAKCYCIRINKEGAMGNAFASINDAMDSGNELDVVITQIHSEKISVNYQGVKGFIYKSNFSSQPISGPKDFFYIGQIIHARPIEINSDARVEFTLAETTSDPSARFFIDYSIGKTITGTVSYVEDTFVKFSIPDSLTTGVAFRSDMTYSRFAFLHQLFPVGSCVEMIVKELNAEDNSLVLRYAHLCDPWKDLKITSGDLVKVIVCKKDDNAIVGEIEEGVTAVLLNEDLAWIREDIMDARSSIKLNEELLCLVSFVDVDNRAVFVSLKQNSINPYLVFLNNNREKDVYAILKEENSSGIYGTIDKLDVFIPGAKTHRGNITYKYKIGKKCIVRIIGISERQDRLIGSFLPFIPYPLADFYDKHPLGETITVGKPLRGTDKYLEFKFTEGKKQYVLNLKVKEVASDGYVENMQSLFDNLSSLSLVLKSIDLDYSRIELSLIDFTRNNKSRLTELEYGKEYQGIVLSKIDSGVIVLLIEYWLEVPVRTRNHFQTGSVVKVIAERLSPPISFQEV